MCPGCYKPNVEGYCPACRKGLFDGKKVSHILPFEAPKDKNVSTYSERTKGLSISGVQPKYSLKLEGNTLVLTDKGGEYILKPISPAIGIQRADQVPENEHLTMHIANVYGISTAVNALIYFQDGTPAYITRRFDLKPAGGKYQQEDFAQLMGKTKDSHGEFFKYDGTYEDMWIAMKKFVPAYMPQAERLFEIILFNYIFSNGDAHLKNFSLIESENLGDYVLSKSYDLLCTVIHTSNETDSALNLYDGDMDVQEDVWGITGRYGQHQFRELARRLGIQEARANRIISKYLERREVILTMIDGSFLSEEAKQLYKKNYLEKIRQLGLTEVQIASKLGVKSKADFPPKFPVRFTNIRGLVFEGELTGVMGDNKYSFLQSRPAIDNPKTTINGDMMVDVVAI
jgi:serine/threonine-protein kinase HipA